MPSIDLNDCEPDLVTRFAEVKRLFEGNLLLWALRVECTLRADAEQLDAFLNHASQIDPRDPEQHKRAMHLADVNGKSRAVDVEIFSRSSGRSADKLLAVKAITQGSYDLLYLVLMLIVERAGLRSGNDWNSDEIAVGPDPRESFFDGGHMELREL
jgi:hypothetical protein